MNKPLEKKAILGSALAVGGATNIGTNALMRTAHGQKIGGSMGISQVADGYRGNVRTNKISNFVRGLIKGNSRDAEDGIEMAREAGKKLKLANIDVLNLSPRAMVGIRRLSKGDLVGGSNILDKINPELRKIVEGTLSDKYGKDHMATQMIRSIGNMSGNKQEINNAFRNTAIPNVIRGAFDKGKNEAGLWKNYSEHEPVSMMDGLKRKIFKESPLNAVSKEEATGRALSSGVSMYRGNVWEGIRQGVGEIARRTDGGTNVLTRGANKVATQVGELANTPDSVMGLMAQNAHARGLSGISNRASELGRNLAYTPLQGANAFVQDQARKVGVLQSKMTGVNKKPLESLEKEKLWDALKRSKKSGGAVADL